MLLDKRGWGLMSVLDIQSLYFFYYFRIKENWISTMTEANINILLTRNLSFDSDVRHWSHHFMILLHFPWAKSNNRMRGQFECNVTSFCFCFDFVCSHVWWGCCSIIYLRCQDLQIKHVDSKMSTKNVNNYK